MTSTQPAAPLSALTRFEKALIATDCSSYSAGAVRVAIAVCAKSGAHLYPFTMVLSNPEYEAIAPELVAKAMEEARAQLDSIVDEAALHDVDATPTIKCGDSPHHEIVSAAEEIAADLIVMGQVGRRGLARMMVGDATARVINAAPCSVLAVPAEARMWERRILLGTDGSRFSEAAAAAAARIAHCCTVPITVVSALVPSHSADRQQEGRDAAERTAAQLRQEGLDAEGLALPGEADEVIIALAQDRRADLVVVGSHGRTGFGKSLLGSVSERVLGRASCAVMVAKA